MLWPRDVMLRERHPFLVATTSYVEGTTYFSRGHKFNMLTNLRDHSNPGLSEMDKTCILLTLNI